MACIASMPSAIVFPASNDAEMVADLYRLKWNKVGGSLLSVKVTTVLNGILSPLLFFTYNLEISAGWLRSALSTCAITGYWCPFMMK